MNNDASHVKETCITHRLSTVFHSAMWNENMASREQGYAASYKKHNFYFIHSVLWQPVCDIYRNGTKLQILECIFDRVAVARKTFWCPFLELSLIHCCPLLSLSSRCLESCWRGSRARSAGQRSRTWCCWTGTGPGSAWWTWWAFC